MCIYRGCTCLKCTNKASMHQQSKYAPTKQVCTNKASMHQQSKDAPTQPHTPHGLKPHKR